MRKLLAFFALVVCGCSNPNSIPSDMMPSQYSVISDLGNGWHVIEIPVDGQKRRFLYRCRYANTNAATEVMVEIKGATHEQR